MDKDPPVNRNVFALLLSTSILHLVFAMTFLLVHRANNLGEIPFHFMADVFPVISFLAQVAILGFSVYAGLYLGRSTGLGAPLLEGWAEGEPVRKRAVAALRISVPIGLAVAAAKYLLDLLVFSLFVPATLSQWRGVPFLVLVHIPFQQGIGDEIVSRLFWMTGLVWLTWKIRGSGDTQLRDSTYWAGIVLAGLIPLPGLILSGTLGLGILQYTVLILAGAIPFGWLYWKKGIESALVAHFTSSGALVLLTLG